jgi:hypothetical protein
MAETSCAWFSSAPTRWSGSGNRPCTTHLYLDQRCIRRADARASCSLPNALPAPKGNPYLLDPSSRDRRSSETSATTLRPNLAGPVCFGVIPPPCVHQ